MGAGLCGIGFQQPVRSGTECLIFRSAKPKCINIPSDITVQVPVTIRKRGGRKNYLFAGSDSGGDRAAAMYAIIQTAKLNDLNLEVYLIDTIARIADAHPINRIDELMPWCQ